MRHFLSRIWQGAARVESLWLDLQRDLVMPGENSATVTATAKTAQ